MRTASALAALFLLAMAAQPGMAGTPVFPLNSVAIQALMYYGVLGPVAVVDPGGTVVWENHEFLQPVVDLHTVTADDGSFASGDIPGHALFRVTFDLPSGTVVSYHCDRHPEIMKGFVVIR
jgi:plastocyanin